MGFEMRPRTEAGEKLLEAIMALAPAVAERADEADRKNQICARNYRELQEAGVARAFVPAELGGMGLESMHDWILAIGALGRADGSTAIAISMHLVQTRGMAARYASAADADTSARLAQQLREVAAGRMLICSSTTESGTDFLHPFTTAVEDGNEWVISGTKHFVTMSPVATHMTFNVRARMSGADHIANVLVSIDAPGLQRRGDWDALGMRASGSQSVAFDACRVPRTALRQVAPWGCWSIPTLVHRTVANVPLLGAFLGIAEAAYEIAVSGLKKRPRRGGAAGAQHAVAEMQIKLATCRCMLTQMGTRLDDFMAAGEPSLEQSYALMRDYQSVKWVVNRGAIEIVNQAMDLAGGGGFVSANPLSRLYRDVRAGPFMQPFSPIDAREYIGRVELGDYPEQ